MLSIFCRARAIAVVLFFASGMAHAAEITLKHDPVMGCFLHLEGTIENGDQTKLVEALDEYANWRQLPNARGNRLPRVQNVDPWDLPNVPRVCLNSPGGSYAEVVRILDETWGRFATAVASDARCESACAVLFMGGTTGNGGTVDDNLGGRVLHPLGKLGFHAPTLVVPDGVYSSDVINQAYATAIKSISRLINIQDKIDFPRSLVVAMVDTPPTKMTYVLTAGQAIDWKIRVAPSRYPDTLTRLGLWNACNNLRPLVEDQLRREVTDIYAPHWDGPELEVSDAAFGGYNGTMKLRVDRNADVICDLYLNEPPDQATDRHPTSAGGYMGVTLGGTDDALRLRFDPYGPSFVTRDTPLSRLARTDDFDWEILNVAKVSAPVTRRSTGFCGVISGARLADYEPCTETVVEAPREDLSSVTTLTYTWPSGSTTVAEVQSKLGQSWGFEADDFRLNGSRAQFWGDGMPDEGDDGNEAGADTACLRFTKDQSQWCPTEFWKNDRTGNTFIYIDAAGLNEALEFGGL